MEWRLSPATTVWVRRAVPPDDGFCGAPAALGRLTDSKVIDAVARKGLPLERNLLAFTFTLLMMAGKLVPPHPKRTKGAHGVPAATDSGVGVQQSRRKSMSFCTSPSGASDASSINSMESDVGLAPPYWSCPMPPGDGWRCQLALNDHDWELGLILAVSCWPPEPGVLRPRAWSAMPAPAPAVPPPIPAAPARLDSSPPPPALGGVLAMKTLSPCVGWPSEIGMAAIGGSSALPRLEEPLAHDLDALRHGLVLTGAPT